MKKIVIAPDSFKESLSALQVAQCIENGFKTAFPNAEYIKIPVADGGEGMVDTLLEAAHGTKIAQSVTSATGEPIAAFWGLSGDNHTAMIEVAAACGLADVSPEQRKPSITTTFGVGELIVSAWDKGVRHFIIGLGGSATNDGGAGMLQALGARFLDKNGNELPRGGLALAQLDRIDIAQLDTRIVQSRFDVACDVNNPLTGEHGAAHVFAPQKGATPEQVMQLDAALKHFADIVRRDLNVEIDNIAGAGAAGGLGAAFAGFLNGHLQSGIKMITDWLRFADAIQGADLVITGEGRIDDQSIKGKVPVGVAQIAKQHNIPVIAIAGSLGKNVEVVHDYGIDAVFSVLPKCCDLREALSMAEANVTQTARNVAAVLAISASLNLKIR